MTSRRFHPFSVPGRTPSYAHLWWTHPTLIFGGILLGTSISAYLIPASAYENEWKTLKFLDTPLLQYIVYCFLAFAAGGLLVSLFSGPLTRPAASVVLENLRMPWRGLRWLFYFAFVTILVAYVIWLVQLLTHGVSLRTLAGALRGEADAAFDLKGVTDGTLPGVTTLVQLAPGLYILGIILGAKFGFRQSLVGIVLPLAALFLITWIRSRLWSERLAVLEVAIPSALIIFRICGTEKLPPFGRLLIGLAPLAAPVLLFLFFCAAEYSRSWVSHYSRYEDSFSLFCFMRLVGYYVTALNNGAMLVQAVHHFNFPYYTLDWFWRFPGIRDIEPYASSPTNDPEKIYLNLLHVGANPEFSNPSGIFLVRLDFGYTGSIFAWFALGAIASALYRGFMKGTRTGLLLYPYFFLGLLETPRILYWTGSRSFPTWSLLFFTLALALFMSQALRPPHTLREGIVRRGRNSGLPLRPLGVGP